jgi:hypothetical protein
MVSLPFDYSLEIIMLIIIKSSLTLQDAVPKLEGEFEKFADRYTTPPPEN